MAKVFSLNSFASSAWVVGCLVGWCTLPAIAQTSSSAPDAVSGATTRVAPASKLTLGGYGEAVATRYFHSDNYLRYTQPERYRDDKGHGRVDLPHVVFFVGYEFGNGWSLNTEIEFEHGGLGSAIEIEEEEAGEYESEIERGGEVALEQFWIQKSFSPHLNLRMGHLVVPVGATNHSHLPTEFFGVYRPEGEQTILPCTWHETGVSLWGRLGDWRYECLLIPGLDSDRFGRKNWINSSAGSPYEFKLANVYASALRIDNYLVSNLRLSLSGYYGHSFRNTLSTNANPRYQHVKGAVSLACFDFLYDNKRLVLRGYADYGHLSDSRAITAYNMAMRKQSPSPKQSVASDAYAIGLEAGYDLLSNASFAQRLFVFVRYDNYDSMYKVDGVAHYAWCGRQRLSAGLNYFPIESIVLKAEYAYGILTAPYNNEPSLSFSLAYAGLFR